MWVLWFVGGDTFDDGVGWDVEEGGDSSGGGHEGNSFLADEEGGDIKGGGIGGEVGFGALPVEFGAVDVNGGFFVLPEGDGVGFGGESGKLVVAGIVAVEDDEGW